MPNAFSIHHDVDFSPQSNRNYFLTVIIGNGQAGSTSFRNPAGNFFSPDVINVPLGAGAQLRNTSMNVVSVVMDINPQTNNMIVSYYIFDRTLTQEDIETLNPTDSVRFTSGPNQTVTFFTRLNFH